MIKWLEAILLAAWSLLMPIHSLIITAGILIGLDLVSGIWAAIKRKEKISSAVLGRTVSKILLYELAIIAGWLCGHYMMGDLVPVSNLVAGAIGVVEIKSILENADSINGSSIFASIIAKIGSSNNQDGNN